MFKKYFSPVNSTLFPVDVSSSLSPSDLLLYIYLPNFFLHGDNVHVISTVTRLTRSWSSSLLVCISCFSSSTIFNIASFSTSSRRSDIWRHIEKERGWWRSAQNQRFIIMSCKTSLLCFHLSPSTWRSYRGQVLLQFLDSLQSSSFGLCILQQCPDIKYVVQVCLNLNLQPVTLCVL